MQLVQRLHELGLIRAERSSMRNWAGILLVQSLRPRVFDNPVWLLQPTDITPFISIKNNVAASVGCANKCDSRSVLIDREIFFVKL